MFVSYQTLLFLLQAHSRGLGWSSERMRWGSCWARELFAPHPSPPSWPPSSPGCCQHRAQTWTWGRGRSCAESSASAGLDGSRKTDLCSDHPGRCWTSGGWAASGKEALCLLLCPQGQPSWLPLVPGRQMCSTCICPMGAREQAGSWLSATASCDGASGTRPDRDPGLDPRRPQREIYLHSCSRVPPGSRSEQMEASKMAKTAGLPTAVLPHGHTTLTTHLCSECGCWRSQLCLHVDGEKELTSRSFSTAWWLSSCEEVERQMKTTVLLSSTNQGSPKTKLADCGFPCKQTRNWNCTQRSLSVVLFVLHSLRSLLFKSVLIFTDEWKKKPACLFVC